MKIKTYAVNCNDAWLNTEGDDISSSYVKYKDHQDVIAALEAKCAALAAELKQSQIDAGCYKKGMEASNERLVQVAAENAGLKELIEQHANSVAVCPNCSHEEPSETDDIVALYRSMETPATDAYLAEVRAQGVEVFAEMYACEAIKDGDVEGWKSKASNAASEYAAQLRQEAAQ